MRFDLEGEVAGQPEGHSTPGVSTLSTTMNMHPALAYLSSALVLVTLVTCTSVPPSPAPSANAVDEAVLAAVLDHDALKVSALLARGHLRDAEGVIRKATEAGDVSVLRLLIGFGPGVNAGVGGNTETLLCTATRLGLEQTVAFLLSIGADPNGRIGPHAAYPPLYEAVRWNHVRVAARLLEGRADPNARLFVDPQGVRPGEKDGPTLLMLAAAAGRTEMVDLLLAWGADPTLKDWKGRSALDWSNDYVSPIPRIRLSLGQVSRHRAGGPSSR
jgi:uncharacterized protein